MRTLRRGRQVSNFWVVAYFLGLTWNQVDHLAEAGKLPIVYAQDGAEYRPSGERLVLADPLADYLTADRHQEFSDWRAGGFEVPSLQVRDAIPGRVDQPSAIGQTGPSPDRSVIGAAQTPAFTAR